MAAVGPDRGRLSVGEGVGVMRVELIEVVIGIFWLIGLEITTARSE